MSILQNIQRYLLKILPYECIMCIDSGKKPINFQCKECSVYDFYPKLLRDIKSEEDYEKHREETPCVD